MLVVYHFQEGWIDTVAAIVIGTGTVVTAHQVALFLTMEAEVLIHLIQNSLVVDFDGFLLDVCWFGRLSKVLLIRTAVTVG